MSNSIEHVSVILAEILAVALCVALVIGRKGTASDRVAIPTRATGTFIEAIQGSAELSFCRLDRDSRVAVKKASPVRLSILTRARANGSGHHG